MIRSDYHTKRICVKQLTIDENFNSEHVNGKLRFVCASDFKQITLWVGNIKVTDAKRICDWLSNGKKQTKL